MRAIVRHAGLNQDQEQRVRAAAAALAAHNIDARTSPWDGTRCDLVLVHGDDVYGQHVMGIARRRGVDVLALSVSRTEQEPGVQWIREDISAEAIAQRLLALMLGRSAAETTPNASALVAGAPLVTAPAVEKPAVPEAPVAQAADAALLRLADDPALAGRDIEARVAGRTVFLLPSTGRVLTATLSDQFATRDRLCEGGWQFRLVRKGQIDASRFEFSGSLEAYLLQGALHHARQLPPFPTQPCSLSDWPDLGSTPEAINALRVVQSLQSRVRTPGMIANECGLDAAYVSACLWAFAAAGLLQRRAQMPDAAAAPASPPEKPVRGVFARLAAHFGLGRAS